MDAILIWFIENIESLALALGCSMLAGFGLGAFCFFHSWWDDQDF